jgi:hypothetical protein
MWENLDSNQTIAQIKQWVFCVFLFIFFLFLMVPTNVFNLMNRGNNKLWREFVSFLQPNLVLIINGLIPACVNFSLSKESYLKKSSKDTSYMKRIYFFVVLNTLILPITATSVESIFKQMQNKNPLNLPQMIA